MTEVTMLQLHPEGPDLWESILPDELRKLPEELARVDELLQDERLMEPFLTKFNQTMGRPTTPIATYLRLMYLKFRYKLGYETLVEEVSDSIRWRQFCGIGVQQRVPDSTTLIKLTQKYGDDTLKDLHNLILENLKERKLIRGRKIRTDTTVVASNIHYPTDASVLIDGLRRFRNSLRRVTGVGLRLGRTWKKAKELLFTIGQVLRQKGKKSKERVKTINKTIVKMVRKTVIKVKRVLRRIKDRRVREQLQTTTDLISQVADQSEQRLDGHVPSDRIVSLADTGARPIVKGKLDKPVEFGRIAQVTQDESGYFTQGDAHPGNPRESTLLMDILSAHEQKFPGALSAVAADMAYGSQDNYDVMQRAGIRVGIGWRGKPSPEHSSQATATLVQELDGVPSRD